MSKYLLEMKGITKTFPGVKALDRVNLQVKKGEIHCLVGENGSGKSTLMKVLSGVYPHGTYAGEIILDGAEQRYQSIADSEKQGIAIIYQELALIPELSVYENIFFGHELVEGGVINWNRTITQAAALLKKVKLDINPSTKIKHLGVGKQQLVEIAKALSKHVKLLILDEPTAALNEDESANLLALMRQFKQQGITCIMITHKLKEIVSIADTITVLRDGMITGSMNAETDTITEQQIIKHMVGREISNIYPKREQSCIGDEAALEIKNWTVFDPVKNREILHNICINVKKGEIVGLAGLMGAGRTELSMSVFGNALGYKIRTGEILFQGVPKRLRHPKDAIKAGLAYVTEDRKGNGLVLMQDVRYNMTLANLHALTEGMVINQNEEIRVANEFVRSVNVKTPSIEQTVNHLSGGNQQKISLAKWMFTKPNILILDEPTRGIDVGAKFEIYSLMNQLVQQGMSIIMISSELLEVLGMVDRLYVMSEGKITGELTAQQATEQAVMKLATSTGGSGNE